MNALYVWFNLQYNFLPMRVINILSLPFSLYSLYISEKSQSVVRQTAAGTNEETEKQSGVGIKLQSALKN